MEGAKTRRPEVFISATSKDLGDCRQVIKESLLTMGCTPIEQTNFAPDGGDVKNMLRRILAHCDAVIHVAGLRYGAEPQSRGAQEARRSYTQLEYEIARELGLPVYVFVCGEGFPYSTCETESELFQELQLEHRRRLLGGDHIFEEVDSEESLALRIHALQDRVKQLSHELARTRSWLGRGLAVAIVVLAMLGFGLWWLADRTDQTEQQLATVQSEMETQRNYIRGTAAAFLDVKAQLAELDLSDEQLWQKALARTAQHAGIPILELEASIELFVAVIGQQESASALDQAYVMFAKGDFQSAGDMAALASKELERQRQASSQLLEQAKLAHQKIQTEQRDALTLVGQSRSAQGQYADAVAAYRSALDPLITAKQEHPLRWAGLQADLGRALHHLADFSEGSAILRHLEESIDRYHSALTIIDKETHPKSWALTQMHLTVTLENQARLSTGKERLRLLDEVIVAYRLIQETATRESSPERWALIQNNLGIAFRLKADSKIGVERLELLSNAIESYRLALQVQTREAFPMEWAVTQNNLAIALGDLARRSPPDERKRLFQEAVEILRSTLEVETRELVPQHWASAQDNLGAALRSLAMESDGTQRQQLLSEVVQAYHLALEVHTRETTPRAWAGTQNNLAIALEDQAASLAGEDSIRLLGEALLAYRHALEVFTRETLPADWAQTQNNIGSLLLQLALENQGELQEQFFLDAEEAMLLSLKVYDLQTFPQDWASSHFNLAILFRHRATYSEGKARADFMGQSALELQDALKVRTREAEPAEWALLQSDLAMTYGIQAQSCQGEERLQALQLGIDAMQRSLQVWTKEDAPEKYKERIEWIDEQLAELNASQE